MATTVICVRGGMANERIDAPTAVQLCGDFVRTHPALSARLPELRGQVLGCWCGDWVPGGPDLACHAVTLATLADGKE